MLKDRYLKAKSKIQLVELDLLHHFQPAVVNPKVQGVETTHVSGWIRVFLTVL